MSQDSFANLFDDIPEPTAIPTIPGVPGMPGNLTERVEASTQSCYWWFTYNNYDDLVIERIKTIPRLHSAVIGREYAPTTGTPHIHVWLRFNGNGQRFSTIKRWIMAGTTRRTDPPGTILRHSPNQLERIKMPQNCLDYVKKGGDYDQYALVNGTITLIPRSAIPETPDAVDDHDGDVVRAGKRGERTDLMKAADILKANPRHANILALLHENDLSGVAMKFPKHVKENQRAFMPSRIGNTGLIGLQKPNGEIFYRPKVTYIYGEPGIGKSAWVHMHTDYAPEDIWNGRIENGFWNDYAGQRYAFIDDFRAGWAKFHDVLRYIDCYPITVNVKNGTMPLLVEHWIFTSTIPPWDIFSGTFDKGGDKEHPWQWYRRISQVLECRKVPGSVAPEYIDRTAWIQDGSWQTRPWSTGAVAPNAVAEDFIL